MTKRASGRTFRAILEALLEASRGRRVGLISSYPLVLLQMCQNTVRSHADLSNGQVRFSNGGFVDVLNHKTCSPQVLFNYDIIVRDDESAD